MEASIDDLAAALAAHFSGALASHAAEGEDPRPVIRGSELENDLSTCTKNRQTPISEVSGDGDVYVAFDWYQATILPISIKDMNASKPMEIMGNYTSEFGGSWEACRPKNGFAEGQKHEPTGVELWWGGQNMHPHLKASGAVSQQVAGWMRSTYPNHRVSRADVALDFSFEGSFDTIHALIEPLARQAGVKLAFMGDTRENDPAFTGARQGRTWYYGAKTSDLRIRLYEKGFEQAGKGASEVDPNWTRLEVVIRPQKTRKLEAASLEPFEMIGFSKWISKAVGEVLMEAPTIIPNIDKQEKNLDHSMAMMLRQYGKKIREFIDKNGWQEFDALVYEGVYTVKERGKLEERRAVPLYARKPAQRAPKMDEAALMERDLIEAAIRARGAPLQ